TGGNATARKRVTFFDKIMLKRIIFQTSIILILSVAAFAQTETVNAPKEQNSTELYVFSIAPIKERFTRGEDIELKVSLQNYDGLLIILPLDRYNEFSSYKFIVKDEKGKEIAQKTDGYPSIGSGVGYEINSQEKYEYTLNLNKRYDLAAGKYKLSALTEIYVRYEAKTLRLTSNTVEFEIVENDQTETRP
ncbi:MAG TPA: hypothetical protein PKY59_20465, partial [Pyrinomonadaceae bacterium]|nr:hypothetical protein [Pyrinomonadaceae bacterium]